MHQLIDSNVGTRYDRNVWLWNGPIGRSTRHTVKTISVCLNKMHGRICGLQWLIELNFGNKSIKQGKTTWRCTRMTIGRWSVGTDTKIACKQPAKIVIFRFNLIKQFWKSRPRWIVGALVSALFADDSHHRTVPGSVRNGFKHNSRSSSHSQCGIYFWGCE